MRAQVAKLIASSWPEKVHLHISFFPTGGDGIRLLVDGAWKAHLDLFDWGKTPLNERQFSLIEVMVKDPKPRSRPLATCKGRKAAVWNYYQKVDSEAEQKERDAEIVQVLLRYCRRRGDGIFYPSKVTQSQIYELARLLPPGGLKPWVLARPSLLEIVENNAERGWGILMKNTSSPAVGGTGSSTDGIASAIRSGAGEQATASGNQETIPASQPAVGGSQRTIPASQPAEEPWNQRAWDQGWTWNEVRNDQDNEYNDWIGWQAQEHQWRGRRWRPS